MERIYEIVGVSVFGGGQCGHRACFCVGLFITLIWFLSSTLRHEHDVGSNLDGATASV
jgi:hypothetical protein